MKDKKPPQLLEVAARIRTIVHTARAALGYDLGYSMLDLVADQIPDLPLRTLEDALVIAGVGWKGPRKPPKVDEKEFADLDNTQDVLDLQNRVASDETEMLF